MTMTIDTREQSPSQARRCPRCSGTGRRLSVQWTVWWAAYEAAEADHRAHYPEVDFASSTAFWQVHEEMPSCPEHVPCATCFGGAAAAPARPAAPARRRP